jgi:hypothetical protein
MWGTRKEYHVEGTIFLCWGLEKEYRYREGEKELKNKNKKIVMEKKTEQLNKMGKKDVRQRNWENITKLKVWNRQRQYRQCAHNVVLRWDWLTIDTVEEQSVLHAVSAYL